MVRNTYNFDQKEESDFWYVVKDSFGGMDELSANVRNEIRRADKSFDFQQIKKEVIEQQGFNIVDKVYKSYVKQDRIMNKNVFNELLASWKKDENDFWGVFDKKNNEFVGFAVIQLYDNACFYSLVAVIPEYKHNTTYPYYGLFYKLNEYYLGEKKFRYVTDGSRSMTEHSNIQQFLIQKLKFRKAYCKLKIHYKWWFGIVVKMLFPLRNVIPSNSVKAVLKMHEIAMKNMK